MYMLHCFICFLNIHQLKIRKIPSSRITLSIHKLSEKRLGTTVTEEDSLTLMLPSLTMCPFGFIEEGKGLNITEDYANLATLEQVIRVQIVIFFTI
jgi:hypothetical protein